MILAVIINHVPDRGAGDEEAPAARGNAHALTVSCISVCTDSVHQARPIILVVLISRKPGGEPDEILPVRLE